MKRLKIITQDKKEKNRQGVYGVTNEIPLTEGLEQYSKNNKLKNKMRASSNMKPHSLTKSLTRLFGC